MSLEIPFNYVWYNFKMQGQLRTKNYIELLGKIGEISLIFHNFQTMNQIRVADIFVHFNFKN